MTKFLRVLGRSAVVGGVLGGLYGAYQIKKMKKGH